jgi:excisionase family DNA binding protein
VKEEPMSSQVAALANEHSLTIGTGAQSEPSNSTLPKLSYSIKEAEKITGVGRTTLWKAINNGKLRCFKVGRRVLFSSEHLKEFLKSHEK